jgi:hypothetical protein
MKAPPLTSRVTPVTKDMAMANPMPRVPPIPTAIQFSISMSRMQAWNQLNIHFNVQNAGMESIKYFSTGLHDRSFIRSNGKIIKTDYNLFVLNLSRNS